LYLAVADQPPERSVVKNIRTLYQSGHWHEAEILANKHFSVTTKQPNLRQEQRLLLEELNALKKKTVEFEKIFGNPRYAIPTKVIASREFLQNSSHVWLRVRTNLPTDLERGFLPLYTGSGS